jgi:hypothetical protein
MLLWPPLTATADFAHLVPANIQAQRLFAKSFEYIRFSKDDYHGKFIDHKVRYQPAIIDQTDSTSYDEDNDQASEPESRGYYVLSLSDGLLPDQPIKGWRVGKGTAKASKNRNVDLLLAKPRDRKTKDLAGIHLFFRFHPQSFMLMLVAGDPEKPVQYKVDGMWKDMKYPSQHVIYQHINRLRLGDCEYDLIYTISEELRKEFLDIQTEYLRSYSIGFKPTEYSGSWTFPPEGGFLKQGPVLMCTSLSYGTFGWVSVGIEVDSGDLVAVKEVAIKRKSDQAQICLEEEIGRSFKVIPSATHQISSRNTYIPRTCLGFYRPFNSGVNIAEQSHVDEFLRKSLCPHRSQYRTSLHINGTWHRIKLCIYAYSDRPYLESRNSISAE